MSNAEETELRARINELQGLYRQCAADIIKLKERKDYSERLKTLFVNIKNHLSKSMEIKHNQFKILMARIEQIEYKLNRIILPENNTNYHLDGFNQSFIDLFQENKLFNLVILEILKYAKFEDEDKRIYVKSKLKQLEDEQ